LGQVAKMLEAHNLLVAFGVVPATRAAKGG
jgi:hypothetical protein